METVQRVEVLPIAQGEYFPLVGDKRFPIEGIGLMEALVLDPHTVKRSKHPGLDEYLIVLLGSITVTIDDREEHKMSPASLLRIPAGCAHRMKVGGEKAVLLCFYKSIE